MALSDGELQFYGFSIGVLTPAGGVSFGAVRAFAVAGFFFCSLMGMVFRNIYLILRTAKGKTWFAKGDTPFQNDIVRMVREIGIFHIGVPVDQHEPGRLYHRYCGSLPISDICLRHRTPAGCGWPGIKEGMSYG